MTRNKPILAACLLLVASLSPLWVADTANAQRPRVPQAGDCDAMVASGVRNIWYGEFSGRAEDSFNTDLVYPIAGRGCFRSERECRRWTNQLLSIGSGSALMRCRPYNRTR